ncbi:MAG: hypothetical protein HN334_02275 [Candidatus Cloacimonetes bacterium]|jgi:hypothetical protein|nr:hypothetical protein [Candidatus Cloacimonadota bacterium]
MLINIVKIMPQKTLKSTYYWGFDENNQVYSLNKSEKFKSSLATNQQKLIQNIILPRNQITRIGAVQIQL